MSQVAPLSLARVHARDAQGPAGRALGRLNGVTMLIHPGVHAFVGAPTDGTAALAEVCSGRRRPRVGAVLVHGREPWRSPAARKRIASLLSRPDLPETLTVREVLALASQVRGQEQLLEELGAGALAKRRVASLELHEARVVELCAALALSEPQLLVLYEPFTECGPVDRARVRDRIAVRAREGACVLVLTSAQGDAELLADRVHLLEGGRVVESTAPGWGSDQRRELCVWLDGGDAPRLAALLGERAELRSVRLRREAGSALVAVEAESLEAAAMVVADVIAAQRIRVSAVQPTSHGETEARP
jgi:ABC-2 type transport system ATP-binding protein